jgi:hypothetical protein
VKTENLAECATMMNFIVENGNEPPANSIQHYATLQESATALYFVQ